MQAQRVYIYEALAVVLTAFMLGTFVGIILAIALTVQQNLFTENVRVARGNTTHVRILVLVHFQAFVFVFPTPLFTFTLGACLVMAVIASYYPTRSLARLPIAGVLKGRTT